MTQDFGIKCLFFLMSTKEKWIQAAKKELGGKDPMESLSRNWSEFQILPYYDHSDLRFNTKSPVRTSARPFAGPNGWLNLPLVDAASSTDANSLALDHLQNGADGFFLKINTKSVAEKLL